MAICTCKVWKLQSDESTSVSDAEGTDGPATEGPRTLACSSLAAVREDQWFSRCFLQPFSGLTVPESGDVPTIRDEGTEFIHWNWKHGRDLLLIFWSQFGEMALEFQSTDFINYLQAIEAAARKISRLIILPTDFNEWLWRTRVLESIFAVCFISANLRVWLVKVQTVIPSWVLSRKGFVCLFAFISPLILCFWNRVF